MDIVTYKAVNKLWRTFGLFAGGALIFGLASNHCYKKLKKQITELEDRVDSLEMELRISRNERERT